MSSGVPPASPTQLTQTQSVASTGGSVSVTFNGQTATVTAPSGAFASTASVSITLYASGSYPRVVQSAQRRTRSLPTGAATIGEITLNSSVAPSKPLKIAITQATPPSGAVVRLAGYGTNGFSDVDTATVTSGTATEDDSASYAGATLASNTAYAFYRIAQANAAAAPTFNVAVTGPTTAVSALGTAQFAATENDGNGFPIFGNALAFSVDSQAIGSVNATTGAFTAGPSDASGNVVATDAAHAVSGKDAVIVSTSVRPSANGDTFTFTGTMTQTLTSAGAPQTPVPQSAQVTQQITSAGAADGVHYTLTNNESDASNLMTDQTQTVSTIVFVPEASSYVVRETQSTTRDVLSNVTYATTYGSGSDTTNGLLTAIPETARTLTNDALATSTENDPGNPGQGTAPTSVRQSAADGTYTQTTWNAGFPATYTENADGSGTASLAGGAYVFQFGAPSGNQIPFVLTTSSGPNSFDAYAWYGAGSPVLSHDTVTIAPSQPLDGSCTAYQGTTTATLVTEQYTAIDTVLGQTETRTTKSYDAPGPGTVCVVVSDEIDTFYDYSGQTQPYAFPLAYATSATPMATTKVTESLSLVAATTAGTSATARSTRSTVSSIRVPVFAAIRAHFDAVATKARVDQAKRMQSLLQRTKGAIR